MAPGDGKGNLEEHFDDGDEDGGHDAHDADGKPADGTFDGAEFHGTGGAQPVGGGTEGKPAGDAALDAQAFQDKRSDGAAENTDHDDHHRRNGRDAAGTLGDAHGDGGGDGLGFEGGNEGMVRPEITGNEDDAEDAWCPLDSTCKHLYTKKGAELQCGNHMMYPHDGSQL